MARSLNKVLLIGNVGKDPEIRYTPAGVPVAQFRLATNEYWRDSEGQLQEATEWHTIVAWRNLAELAERQIQRGSRLFIEGRIRSRSYEDSSGAKRTAFEIIADSIIVLDGRKESSPSPPDTPSDTDTSSQDLPF
ncbi:MAG: single-stranded DNA-binding protein [Bacteroidota bacterium]|nr:single-stranded DNA-binding protein [Candidatus Kapabacteria bacterium]MCS7303427.1 single-stranded DNA-binding protein [Candidatus Kapabacteria bacterium]MCX7937143.1 single-stranded DNA-binding protein [Chlorobiota bacterium]MDW8075220.1 single-stranded DNA-binding protein [Bacteroidota bacterium]MDW8271833.1 single-stranded DNA-binding protein [Bacteroidota bacterium]